MDAITMDGDEVNRKGALEGGFHDERRSRLVAYLGIQEAKAALAKEEAAQTSAEAKSMEVDTGYENDFSLFNSFWFSMGALMFQGSDNCPK